MIPCSSVYNSSYFIYLLCFKLHYRKMDPFIYNTNLPARSGGNTLQSGKMLYCNLEHRIPILPKIVHELLKRVKPRGQWHNDIYYHPGGVDSFLHHILQRCKRPKKLQSPKFQRSIVSECEII